MKKYLILVLLFCVSCMTQNFIKQYNLEKYKWVFFKYEVIKDDNIEIVPFIYNEIKFSKNILIFYSITGYATIKGKIVEVIEEEIFYLDYVLSNNKLIIINDDSNELILKMDEKGNFILGEKIFEKHFIFDIEGKII